MSSCAAGLTLKKTFIFFIILISFSTMTFGQKLSEKKLPKNIKQHFHKNYPNANNAHWEMIKSKYYATFDYDGFSTCVTYDYAGVWFETETKVIIWQMPYQVLSTVNTKYTGYKVNKALRLDSSICSNEIYKLEVEKDNITSMISVTSEGILLNETESIQ